MALAAYFDDLCTPFTVFTPPWSYGVSRHLVSPIRGVNRLYGHYNFGNDLTSLALLTAARSLDDAHAS